MKLVREHPQQVIDALAKREETVDLQAILELDGQCRARRISLEALRLERNQLSKQIGQLRGKGQDAAAEQARAEAVNAEIKAMEPELDDMEARLQDQLLELPNMPAPDVIGGGKENNTVVRVHGDKPALFDGAQDHVEISRRLNLVDYERGVKLGGSGFWLYRGLGAAMEWALIDYFCRTHYADGYEFVLPPHLLTPEGGVAAGQFPKFVDDVFHLKTKTGERERFLIPTAETALLNIYRDEVIPTADLPVKMYAYTPCYRREGGGSRADERGTVRGHQFNKVEMFQFVTPEGAAAALDELIGKAESLLSSLGLHYRTTLLAAGDTSASMAKTYDVEVWIPSIGAYKEVSSVSWAGDYQARRAKIRYRPDGEKANQFVHTLNGSGLATSRLLPALLEQHQLPDGSINVPEPLRPWLGRDRLTAG